MQLNSTACDRKRLQISFPKDLNLRLKPNPVHDDLRQHLRSFVQENTSPSISDFLDMFRAKPLVLEQFACGDGGSTQRELSNEP